MQFLNNNSRELNNVEKDIGKKLENKIYLEISKYLRRKSTVLRDSNELTNISETL